MISIVLHSNSQTLWNNYRRKNYYTICLNSTQSVDGGERSPCPCLVRIRFALCAQASFLDPAWLLYKTYIWHVLWRVNGTRTHWDPRWWCAGHPEDELAAWRLCSVRLSVALLGAGHADALVAAPLLLLLLLLLQPLYYWFDRRRSSRRCLVPVKVIYLYLWWLLLSSVTGSVPAQMPVIA